MTDTKKTIKILMYADSVENRVGQTIPYMEFMSQFGEVILVHPQNDLEFFMELGDVLLVPGGLDLSPAASNDKPTFSTTRANAQYEYLDKYLLTPWLAKGKPTIGICRGAQAINVALGGTLHQHVKGHVQSSKKARSEEAEEMYTFDEDTNFRIVDINSFHHQAIDKLGDGLTITGWSTAATNCPTVIQAKRNKIKGRAYPKMIKGKKDYLVSRDKYFAIVEAFESTSDSIYNIVAFQYHPEELNCPYAISKIDALLNLTAN